MRLVTILKRESPLLVAREVLWRAHRKWNKNLLFSRLERPRNVCFRNVAYYDPDLRFLSGPTRSLVVAFADHIQAGRYPLLSYGTAELGTCPKWNLDFVSGAEWPARDKSHRHSPRGGADIKAPYELSRLQFLPVLGKAYALTSKESYRRTAKDLLSYWIQANPVPVGVNWTIAMEAALRAMSICFLLSLLSPFGPEEQPWLASVTGSLMNHLVYIEANIEFSYFLSSNHYLSNIVGLYCLSMFLDGEGMVARRRQYRQRIEAEMEKQVYEDGGDYEASTGYQTLTTQLFTTSLLMMRAAGDIPAHSAFVNRLRMMFRFLNTLANRFGELPQVGDCDDGRTELLADDLRQTILCAVAQRNSLRVTSLLGLGQRLFGEGSGSGDDAAWYGLTENTAIPYPQPSTKQDSAYPITILPKSGISRLQHRSADLLFFAMPNGIFGKGSHTHNDKLSFVLRIEGREILCDSGTGCYSRDITTRNCFRSTSAHNTLLIDGTEQNRMDQGPHGLFRLGNEAAVTQIKEGKGPGGAFLRASHAGYCALGVLHTRTIHMICEEPAFLIEDELNGHGLHDVELNFQVASNHSAEVFSAETGLICRILGHAQVELRISGPVALQGCVHPSLISTAYGVTVPSMRVRVWGSVTVPNRISTRISWIESH